VEDLVSLTLEDGGIIFEDGGIIFLRKVGNQKVCDKASQPRRSESSTTTTTTTTTTRLWKPQISHGVKLFTSLKPALLYEF
jgi:hypothetical protein